MPAAGHRALARRPPGRGPADSLLPRYGTRWIPARSTFLFPVRALAKVFRGRYLAGLQRAFVRGDLHLTGGLAPLAEPAAFTAWLAALRRPAWVVYCKPPFAGPEHVLAYLGRYTHRIALSNDRLLAVHDGRVHFRWRDYAAGDRVRVMALDVDEFLRRFLLHVVPDGFVRLRHFGLLANRRRAAALTQCRALLAQPPPPIVPPESARDLVLRVTGRDLDRCSRCPQGVLRRLDVRRLRPRPPISPAPAAGGSAAVCVCMPLEPLGPAGRPRVSPMPDPAHPALGASPSARPAAPTHRSPS